MIDGFDQHADEYRAYLSDHAGMERLELAWQHLREHLDAIACRTAIDLGGGPGDLAVRLVREGFEVILVDAAPSMIAIARENRDALELARRPSMQLRCARISELSPSSFGLVLCHWTLEYLERSEAEAIAPLLSPATVFSVIVPEAESGEPSEVRTADRLFGVPRRRFSEEELRAWLRSMGVLAPSMRRISGRYLHAIGESTAPCE